MSTPYPPFYAYPSAPPLQRPMPTPPRLHWGWVLALTLVTFGVFASIWLLVQANWIRKMRLGKSVAFWLALANLLWIPLVFLLAFAAGVATRLAPGVNAAGWIRSLDPLFRMGGFILFLCAAFTMRSEMEAEPIGLTLSGTMTFFFAVFYFQYQLSDFGHAYRSEGGLGLTSQSNLAREPEPVAYPTAAAVGVAYPPHNVPPGELPPQP